MCGIVASIAFDNKRFNNNSRVIRQFLEQKHRGTDGFGFVAFNMGDVVLARSKTESKIKDLLKEVDTNDFILFHHRIPTCSPNSTTANHPILVENKTLKHKYYLIHNGQISNCDELREEHEKAGFTYTTISKKKYSSSTSVLETYTDTEALAIEFALYNEGKINAIRARGWIAIIVLETDGENTPLKIHYYRNTAPLKMYVNQFGIFLSSEGKGFDVKKDTLFTIDLKTRKITNKHLAIPAYSYTEYSGYEYYPEYNSEHIEVYDDLGIFTDDPFRARNLNSIKTLSTDTLSDVLGDLESQKDFLKDSLQQMKEGGYGAKETINDFDGNYRKVATQCSLVREELKRRDHTHRQPSPLL